MLTKHPNIVIALPPKRTRRPKAKPADMPKAPVIVEARDPQRIKREPALTRRVVDQRTNDIPDEEHHERGEAADRLWQEIKRAVAKQR
ncbi:MAG TPA: hypothetical protein VMD56_03100 [Steroidobacteraceae bacterium]|nr:hypothetical protein [Steroidobacteraceae bacterium]